MNILPAASRSQMEKFFRFSRTLYKNNRAYRRTIEDTARHVLDKHNAFHSQAQIKPCLVTLHGKLSARFVLIRHNRLPEYVQVAFFEALPGLQGLAGAIRNCARTLFPGTPQLVVGLNGHLNYGCGLLLNQFERIPVYDMPHNPPYYSDYFSGFRQKRIVSYQFPATPFFSSLKQTAAKVRGKITTRYMNKKRFRQEIALYTHLNNVCFKRHPYWTERTEKEDYELFRPLYAFLDRENLIFAIYRGQPVGFLLWFPDFHQLIDHRQELGICQWLKFRLASPIDRFRLAEIAVLPHCRVSNASLALLSRLAEAVAVRKYSRGEGGFIFEENRNSIRLADKYILRALGKAAEVDRCYAVFESDLTGEE